MTPIPSYLEDRVSQIPAARLLMAMGWQYLTPDQALNARGGSHSAVILTDILSAWLRQHNTITHRGRVIPFSDKNIAAAVRKLTDLDLSTGLIPTSEKVYELLTLGASFEQEIDGDRKSHSLKFIDWQTPANNVYHVTEEFSVTRRALSGEKSRRPDLVLFVNGIPLVVIECKRPDKETSGGKPSVYEAASQMLRNQKLDEEIPHLFAYAQMLIAVSGNGALYATTAATEKYWSVWSEENPDEAEIHRVINQPLSAGEKSALYDWRDYPGGVRHYFDELDAAGDRLATGQDRLLHALLRPKRLLELVYQYIVYDGGVKKIARHQQFYAIRATLDKVAHLGVGGSRSGGVIWHTTGSGKSLTMVMLAKALTLMKSIRNPRVIIVTDRIDLDRQIWRTFHHCGKQPHKANSGAQLIDLIRNPENEIITTVIDKFDAAWKAKLTDASPDVFVLVDESHRSQFGLSHAAMKTVFPNGCYIGFTGTPLLKAEKSTLDKFGGLIHSYSMREAVEDQAVVPLLYEGRVIDLEVNRSALDTWFDRRTADLTDDQRADLKRKMSRYEEVDRVRARLQVVAYDIATHYKKNFRKTGLKAQLATSSKDTAIRMRALLRDEGINCEVVISAPDTREGNDSAEAAASNAVQAFWTERMRQYGGEKHYLDEVIKSFGDADGFELLIVVDKLLVGFDEPRNTVLYIDKPLKEHGLLQAIARVNRLYPGKAHGFIIDYRGVLGELDAAMQMYDALAGYDPKDLEGAFTDVSTEIADLAGLHHQVWAIFDPVPNKADREALERYLEPQNIRESFYEALSTFASALRTALATVVFYETTPESQIATYKRDLVFFHGLRQSAQLRYAERIDYGTYEAQIRKLLDDHIGAERVTVLTPEVNIFDENAFAAAVAQLETPAARAESIANHIKKVATERMSEDPAYFRKFSQLVEEAIALYREGRISETELLTHMQDAERDFREGHDDSIPKSIASLRDARAYFGILSETLTPLMDSAAVQPETLAMLAFDCKQRIDDMKIRDWALNPDRINDMRDALDVLLYKFCRKHGIALPAGVIETLIDAVITAAKSQELSET